jgi:hypothetical protein
MNKIEENTKRRVVVTGMGTVARRGRRGGSCFFDSGTLSPNIAADYQL